MTKIATRLTLGLLLLFCGLSSSGQAIHQHSPAELRQDLEFFARELPKRHKNAFHYTSAEQFQAAVKDLAARLETLDDDGFFVGLMRIGAMIGDAHTRVHLPLESQRAFPVAIRNYGEEGYRLVLVGAGLEKALGARIVKIDETPAERFYSLLSPLAAQNENPTFAPAWVSLFLERPDILHGAGITALPDKARFTLQDDAGRQFSLEIAAVSAAEYQKLAWIRLVKKTHLEEISEPMLNPSPTFSYTYIPSARTVYANVRGMVDVKTPGQALMKFIQERQPEKLIVDLRQNPGGDYFHGLHDLIEPIAKLAEINRKGHLFVLIGPLTGSAAIINAAQFHTMTQAILVGEAIGAKPTEYSELKNMTLPHTGIIVGYSICFYDFSYDKENIVLPDHEAKPTWSEAKQGINPALEWCLAYGR